MEKKQKKKHHVVRNVLIILASVVVAIYGTAAILICDFTDNTPDYISEVEGESITDFLGKKAEESLRNTGPLDDFEYLFDQREINDLLATVVPLIKIPIPTIEIKSIYVEIDENDAISAEAPFHAFLLRSCAKASGFLSYDRTTISFRLDEVAVQHLNSSRGIVKSILSESTVSSIEQAIQGCGVELSLVKQGDGFFASMTNLGICQTIVNCTKGSEVGFLSAALVGGALNADNVEVVANVNGKTGVIIHRGLISLS